MRVVITVTAAVLSIAAASSVPGDQGEALARSLQTTVLDRVLHVYRDYGRHLQTPELINENPEDPKPELISWGGDTSICSMFNLPIVKGHLEDEGLSCDCSSTDSIMNMFCETNENFDESMLESHCGSMLNPTMNVTMSNPMSMSYDDFSTHSEVCATFGDDYGSGDGDSCTEKLSNHRFCIGVGMTLTMPDFEEGIGEIDMDDFLQMTCSVELDPNYDCTCEICDNFMGIEAVCTDDDNRELRMNCTEGFSVSDPTTEPGFGDDSGMSIIDGVESSFIVPQFFEQDNIAVTDSVENDEGNTSDGTSDGEDNGAAGGDDSGNVDTGSEDGGTLTSDGDGDGDGDDAGDGSVDATLAGDDSGGSFMQTTYSLVASATAFLVMSVVA